MSILINGMEMPKSCSECFMKFCDGRKTVVHFTVERSPHCPLAHVPPHGRLIDADDTENITVIMNENGCGFNRIIAPIIIEAEGET